MTFTQKEPTQFGAPETMYCAEQIKIPSELPEILKNYTKFVIKSQPSDILSASAEYFTRLAKQRSKTPNARPKLTAQQLEAFYRKLSTAPQQSFTRLEISQICTDVPQTLLADILSLGGFPDSDIPWQKYWALLTSAVAGSLHAALEVMTDILGDNGSVPVEPLLTMITYLAERDPAVPRTQIGRWVKGIRDRGEVVEISLLLETLAQEVPVKFEVLAPAVSYSKEVPKSAEKVESRPVTAGDVEVVQEVKDKEEEDFNEEVIDAANEEVEAVEDSGERDLS